jgi:hypothetical protein
LSREAEELLRRYRKKVEAIIEITPELESIIKEVYPILSVKEISRALQIGHERTSDLLDIVGIEVRSSGKRGRGKSKKGASGSAKSSCNMKKRVREK